MASAKNRPVYWPIDVMCACMAALDTIVAEDEARTEALAIYAVASAAREADRKIPIPAWLEKHVEEN